MLESILAKLLRDTADDLEAGNLTCSESDAKEVLEKMGELHPNREMSKDLACAYLNMSRSTFDANVRCGLIPRGKKQRGFKELSWNKCDLDGFKLEQKRLQEISTPSI